MEQPLDTSIFPDRPVAYATFWQRLGAMLIDGLILYIPQKLLQYMGPMLGLLVIVLQWLYFALQESSPAQATIGKRALGIKVTTIHGDKITFGQATGRYFGKIVSFIILLIGYFMMLWDDKRQTLHDKMAGTIVVSAK